MAVTYAPFGGRRTSMNDYERADQQNALANAQMQQQSLMQGSNLAGQRGMADVTHNQALAVLDQQHGNQLSQMDRRNELNEQFRAGGLDFADYYEGGGREAQNAANQLALTQTGNNQAVAEAQGRLMGPALSELDTMFTPEQQAALAGSLVSGGAIDLERNRMNQEQLQYDRDRQDVQDEIQRNQAELSRVDSQRQMVGENYFRLAEVEQGRGNYARASQLMRQGLGVLLHGANPDDFSTDAEGILPQESEQTGIEQMQLVQEIAQRVASVVPKEGLAKDLAKELMQEQTGEPIPPTRSGMLIWEEANKVGMADSRADFMNVYRQILKDLMQDPNIRRSVTDSLPRNSSWHLGRLNPVVAITERSQDRSAAVSAFDETLR